MNRYKVNFDEIQKAMEDVSRDTFDYFLDIETGEVMALSDEILGEIKSRLYDSDSDEIGDDIEYIEYDEEPEIPDWMEDELEMALEILLNENGRYIRIPERKPSRAYKTMADFIDTLEESVLREKLSGVLNGKGAFKRFKKVLIDYPKERKKWHGYNAKAVKNEIIEWMNTLDKKPAT
ncbi:MAG: hypothetical protein A2Y97_10235 [Nitrospirae bacterium RBG_13_39_12]|nr:MAG: hypothetical protein A2Y97_10235 [Nitrospirae bacterium RBG_13_39_12]